MRDSQAGGGVLEDVVRRAIRDREAGVAAEKAAAEAKWRESAPRRECLAALGELAGIDPEAAEWWRRAYPKLLVRAAKSYLKWKGSADLPDDPSLARPEFAVARALMTKALGGAVLETLMEDCAAILGACEEKRDMACLQGMLAFPSVLLDILKGRHPRSSSARPEPLGGDVSSRGKASRGRGCEAPETPTPRKKRKRNRPEPKPGWIYVADAEQKYQIPRTTLDRYRRRLPPEDNCKNEDVGMILVRRKALEDELRRRSRWPQ